MKDIRRRLRAHGIRATRQRLFLADIMFSGSPRHVTADMLASEARQRGLRISLATVYNTLHQFCQAGLLKEIRISRSAMYFDTDTSPHFHFFLEDEGRLVDIDACNISIGAMPMPPDGCELTEMELLIRVRQRDRVAAGERVF